MNREQMVKRVEAVLYGDAEAVDPEERAELSVAVLDAILPQVTTVAEMQALSGRTVIINDVGVPYWLEDSDRPSLRAALMVHGPFTVVWTPEATS